MILFDDTYFRLIIKAYVCMRMDLCEIVKLLPTFYGMFLVHVHVFYVMVTTSMGMPL